MNKGQTVSIAFTEDMKGYVTIDGAQQKLMFHLTITIPDIDYFLLDPLQQGVAEGYIECAALGGRLGVKAGVFHCFVDAGVPHEDIKHMEYALPFVDASGAGRVLVGHKVVKDDGILHLWRDTSTLFYEIAGVGEGVLRILKRDFARQMLSYRTTGPSLFKRWGGLIKFNAHFAATLWSIYVSRSGPIADITRERDIPLYTLSGVVDAEITTHYVETEDKLTLSMFRFKRRPTKDVVVLLHGLSTSTDMFIMPEHKNLVSYLLDNGYPDVFSFDWRGSMRHNYDLFPNTFNLDDIALYDHPAALRVVRKIVGEDARIHVICHCVGSITFMMSLFAGLVDVASVISNSVSLTPRVTRFGRMKIAIAPGLISYVLRFPNLNPRWASLPGPGIPQGKIIAKLVGLVHRECDVPECKMLSFMWGVGHPAVYQHENMLDVTHRRVGDLFGAVSVSFYRHLRTCLSAGKVVKYRDKDPRYDRLPNDYFDRASEVRTPILFISGAQNRVFHGSNAATVAALKRLDPTGPFTYQEIPGYGHQDPFMGKHVDVDVFPIFLTHLNRYAVDALVERAVS